MGRDDSEPELSDGDLIKALKALADPTRFRIMQAIADAGELSCGQACDLFDVSQPTISHHLKVLADAELLIRRTEGKHHFTSVNHALLGRLGALLPTRLAPGTARRKSKKEPSRASRTS